MSQAKLVIQNLYKIFGDHPERAYPLLEQDLGKDEIFAQTGLTVGVRDASFEIRAGEVFVIMGLSGSGKSTLVRLLNRLIEPTAGQVLLDRRDVASISAAELRELRRHEMSMVFQSFALMPHLNVVQNAAFGLDLAGIDEDECEQRALEALDQVGLKANAQSYPDELSGGMQQRVGLARALAIGSDVLLMDEAFSALDPLIRTEMQDELVKLQQQQKRTIVFISHDLDEAMRIGDRIAIMEAGQIVQIGTPEEILNNPANDYVQSFFKGVNVAQVYTASEVTQSDAGTVLHRSEIDSPEQALNKMRNQHVNYAYVVESGNKFVAVVSQASIERALEKNGKLDDAFLDAPRPANSDTLLGDLIDPVAAAICSVPIVDQNGIYQGVITKSALLNILGSQKTEV